ncbi:MAG TPA: polymer-forming cytoskeletal protein [Vicinamibacteria bacterium]|nr:polymer-forming cytoskeletal protein [Vicinamibacteria bacterium]
MWKKTSTGEFPEERPPVGAPPRPAAAPPTVATKVPAARVGSTLYFRGDLQGEEDLVIEGRVEGKISIKQGNVSVGERGRVEADIEAASIQVAGLVKGNLTGADRVVLLESGRVEGNITARSVSLENGCHFKGSIDMQSDSAVRTSAKSTTLSATSPVQPPKSNGSDQPATAPTTPPRVGV